MRCDGIDVLATDYDRTLTDDALAPVVEALDALAEARKAGLKVIVVSGRGIRFLEKEVGHVADALVAENGCLVSRPGQAPIATGGCDVDLHERLLAAGVEAEVGDVLASFWTRDVERVLPHLRGVAVHLVRNRDRTMLLPQGVDKATGLRVALRLLGHDLESAAAAGDGENDLPMIRAVAHGIAVANAVPALKEHATFVTSRPGGHGIAEWVREIWLPTREGTR